MKFYLIGFMGSGKSTFGEILAKELGLNFHDLDTRIIEMEGDSISTIFSEKGPEYFREVERKALHETASMTNTVIATGGGAPCFFDNLDFMKKEGKVIYFKVAEERLHQNLMKVKKDRPLIKELSNKELKDFIREKIQEREKFYLKSDIQVNPFEYPVKLWASKIK